MTGLWAFLLLTPQDFADLEGDTMTPETEQAIWSYLADHINDEQEQPNELTYTIYS